MTLAVEKPAVGAAIKNILFATDFSGASEAALPYLSAFAECYGSTLHAVHVLPTVTFLRPGAPDSTVVGPIYEDAHKNAQDKLARLERRLHEFSPRTYLRHGRTCEAIEEVIRELDIDLLVAGTHGRTGLGKLVMGSVAEEILRRATCPVLTVGPGVVAGLHAEAVHDRNLPPSAIQIRRILYATDFKQDWAEAMAHAVSLACHFQAKLALLHVIEDYGSRLHDKPGPVDVALQRLKTFLPEDAELPFAPEFLAQFGPGADSILQTAAERDIDLIILGARPIHGGAGLSTHFSRTVAHRIIVGAHCPVLTVHTYNQALSAL